MTEINEHGLPIGPVVSDWTRPPWPALKVAFETWLDDANFDPERNQCQRLSALTAHMLFARDPAVDQGGATG
ncbi:MAG: hypothetical protein CMM26_00650 [Rhodospirillaceae bacterium]|nr:hypothetical protein [Rhodospirillaceae bacterium]